MCIRDSHEAPLPKQLPNHLDRITRKVRVGSDQREFFLDTLGDQHAVEWIAVMHGQRFDSQDMVQSNRQDLDPVSCGLLHQVRACRLRQGKFACLYFDQYLPDAGRTQPEIVGSGKYLLRPACWLRKIGGFALQSRKVAKQLRPFIIVGARVAVKMKGFALLQLRP